MSDLPSRKFIKTNGERFKSLPRWVQEVALPIVVAYLEGRLVDREAIGYEAANEAATCWAAYLAGEISYPFGSMVAAEAIVAAAIGDGAVADLVEVGEVFTGSGWIPLSNLDAAIGEGDEGADS